MLELRCVACLDHARGVRLHFQENSGYVFAIDIGVDPLGFAAELLDLSHEEASQVEQVNPKVIEDEPPILGQVGLIGVHVVGAAEADPPKEQRAQVLSCLLESPHWSLPAEVLVDHERHLRIPARVDDCSGLRKARREGLLANYGHLLTEGNLHQGPVSSGSSHDVHEVEGPGVKHLLNVGLYAFDADLAGASLCLGLVKVTDRYNL